MMPNRKSAKESSVEQLTVPPLPSRMELGTTVKPLRENWNNREGRFGAVERRNSPPFAVPHLRSVGSPG